MTKEQIINEALPVFVTLAQDEQDSVRLLTVEDMIAIAEKMSHEEVKQHLAPIMRSICQDKSWRVRYMVADKFVNVALLLFLLIRCSVVKKKRKVGKSSWS